MTKDDIIKSLQWSKEDLEILRQMKEEKANSLLLACIYNKDEEGARILLFDKTIEVNATTNSNNYEYLLLAIKKSMINFVKDIFLHDNPNYRVNIEKVLCQDFYLNLAKSNNTQLYDFFEEITSRKKIILSDTLFYALIFGNLPLIKHLINKKINDEYLPVNLENAIDGYDTYLEEQKKEISEYVNYFANIEKYTSNKYINEQSKNKFFSSKLLLRISYKRDINTLKLHKSIISEEQCKKHIEEFIKLQEYEIKENKSKIVTALKWLFLNTLDIDLTTSHFIREGLKKNADLIQFYDKVLLNKKLNNLLEEKNNKNKTNKI